MRKVLIVIFILLIGTTLHAFRASRPPKLTNPLDGGQISQLNEYLEQIWYMQQGRSELDIVTTTKTNARNGEIWIIWTSPVARIQYRARNQIFTLTPDGY